VAKLRCSQLHTSRCLRRRERKHKLLKFRLLAIAFNKGIKLQPAINYTVFNFFNNYNLVILAIEKPFFNFPIELLESFEGFTSSESVGTRKPSEEHP